MSEESHETHTKEQQIPVYVWIVAGLILLAAGWFGFKMLIAPFQEYRVTLVNGPKEAFAGSGTAFTWRIDGPATTISSTVVYYGTASNPGELGKDVKPGDTRYTDFVKDFASGTFNVPLQFVGNTQLPATPGTYYYRVYAVVGEKNYWSEEYAMEVKQPTASDYGITLVHAPPQAAAEDTMAFTWRVDGPPTEINHTSVHFGLRSTPGTLEKTVAPADTRYTDMIGDFAKGKYNIPLQFVGNVQVATPGAYFFRAHAIIGTQHFWTEEKTFEVTKKITPSATPRAARATATPKETE